MEITVKNLIIELLKADETNYDKKIIGIGTYAGSDRPAEYSIRLEDSTEIMIGERKWK